MLLPRRSAHLAPPLCSCPSPPRSPRAPPRVAPHARRRCRPRRRRHWWRLVWRRRCRRGVRARRPRWSSARRTRRGWRSCAPSWGIPWVEARRNPNVLGLWVQSRMDAGTHVHAGKWGVVACRYLPLCACLYAMSRLCVSHHTERERERELSLRPHLPISRDAARAARDGHGDLAFGVGEKTDTRCVENREICEFFLPACLAR